MCARRRRSVCAACALVALGAGGCDDTVTQDHCQRARAAIERLWQSETAAQGDAGVYVAFSREQGGRLADSFAMRCRAGVIGRPLGPGELACIEGAGSLDELVACAR